MTDRHCCLRHSRHRHVVVIPALCTSTCGTPSSEHLRQSCLCGGDIGHVKVSVSAEIRSGVDRSATIAAAPVDGHMSMWTMTCIPSAANGWQIALPSVTEPPLPRRVS